MALHERLSPKREQVLPFLTLAYPSWWLLLGRLCPLSTGARTECFTLFPGRYAGYLLAALVGSYLLAVVLVETLSGRADAFGRPFAIQPSTRALVLTGLLSAVFWAARVLSTVMTPGVSVELLLVPLWLPVVVIWAGMIAVGNAIGEPAMAVQYVVFAVALALNGAWIVLVSMAVDRFVERWVRRSGTDSTGSQNA